MNNNLFYWNTVIIYEKATQHGLQRTKFCKTKILLQNRRAQFFNAIWNVWKRKKNIFQKMCQSVNDVNGNTYEIDVFCLNDVENGAFVKLMSKLTENLYLTFKYIFFAITFQNKCIYNYVRFVNKLHIKICLCIWPLRIRPVSELERYQDLNTLLTLISLEKYTISFKNQYHIWVLTLPSICILYL